VVTDLSAAQYTLPAQDQTQIALNITTVQRNSVDCWLDGTLMPMNDTDQISYSVVYDTNQTIITIFTGVGLGVQDGQQYIVRFNWVENV
jgi:hypothetical protein